MYSTAFAILGVILLLTIVPTSVVTAADAPTAAAMTDNAPSLPVKTEFEKVSSGINRGLYELKVTNASDKSLMVMAAVRISVPVHNQSKIRELPSYVIEAGKSWTIDELAPHDIVTLAASGFAPLEVTVP